MNPKTKLAEARDKAKLTQAKIAQLCNMEQTTYSKKERGISSINNLEWKKFAEILNVDIEDIKEEDNYSIINENCTFNEHAIFSSNVNYINMPKEAWNVMLKYIETLEEKIKNNF